METSNELADPQIKGIGAYHVFTRLCSRSSAFQYNSVPFRPLDEVLTL